MPGESYILLPHAEPLAARHAQLQFDEIKPGDRLGDGMLDLQPRVHFHEIEFVAPIEQEFKRTGAFIAKRFDRGHCDGAHPRTQLR